MTALGHQLPRPITKKTCLLVPEKNKEPVRILNPYIQQVLFILKNNQKKQTQSGIKLEMGEREVCLSSPTTGHTVWSCASHAS